MLLFVCKQSLETKVVAFCSFSVLHYQGELGSHCRATTSFYKSGSNKACCPLGGGRCAEICLALLYPLAKPGVKAKTGGADSPGSNMSHTLLSLAAPSQQDSRSLGCCPLLSDDREQSSLCLQCGFDLGIKSLQCISFFPRLCCSS